MRHEHLTTDVCTWYEKKQFKQKLKDDIKQLFKGIFSEIIETLKSKCNVTQCDEKTVKALDHCAEAAQGQLTYVQKDLNPSFGRPRARRFI